MTRRIAVVTGTRADYGLLRWLIADLLADPRVEGQVVVTGAHLSEQHGMTVDAIRDDGVPIAAEVPILGDRDDELGVAIAASRAVEGLAAAFDRLRPDIVVLLGDRYEILAAALAATLLRIPIAHLHGGELTAGAIDDAMRHAVTKLAHLHFTAAASYRDRVIQLGEDPARVHLVGALGLDGFDRLDLLDEAALSQALGVELRHPLAVVTMLPETLSARSPVDTVGPLLAALAARPELQVIATLGNADAGGQAISQAMLAFAESHPGRVRAFTSLGQLRYLSLLRQADVLIGNSSSGILEAPSVGTPTVDIGDRQKGRLRAASVIHADNEEDAIGVAIDEALSPGHRDIAARRQSPFGTPGASRRVAAELATVDLDGILLKGFHDLEARP